MIIIKYSHMHADFMKEGKVNRFKVDENGYTADGYRRLEPESKKSMYLGNIIGIIISAIVILAVAHYCEPWVGDHYGLVRTLLYVLLAVIIVYAVAEPEITYRRYRYRMDDDKIEVRRGIIYISHVMVPIERVHQVDVSEGPINRMYGLANVNITTAGGVVTIEYLKEDVAESIASKLNENVVKLLKERD